MEEEPMAENLRSLDTAEIEERLEQLDGWEYRDGMLRREFVFPNFVEAIGFLTRAAIHAERLNHHPDWSNLYNTVRVALETHDVGGISHLDFDLAMTMNGLAST